MSTREKPLAAASSRAFRGPTEQHRAPNDASSYTQQRAPAGMRELLRSLVAHV